MKEKIAGNCLTSPLLPHHPFPHAPLFPIFFRTFFFPIESNPAELSHSNLLAYVFQSYLKAHKASYFKPQVKGLFGMFCFLIHCLMRLNEI